jgi:hypothetical protein
MHPAIQGHTRSRIPAVVDLGEGPVAVSSSLSGDKATALAHTGTPARLRPQSPSQFYGCEKAQHEGNRRGELEGTTTPVLRPTGWAAAGGFFSARGPSWQSHFFRITKGLGNLCHTMLLPSS